MSQQLVIHNFHSETRRGKRHNAVPRFMYEYICMYCTYEQYTWRKNIHLRKVPTNLPFFNLGHSDDLPCYQVANGCTTPQRVSVPVGIFCVSAAMSKENNTFQILACLFPPCVQSDQRRGSLPATVTKRPHQLKCREPKFFWRPIGSSWARPRPLGRECWSLPWTFCPLLIGVIIFRIKSNFFPKRTLFL